MVSASSSKLASSDVDNVDSGNTEILLVERSNSWNGENIAMSSSND